MRAAWTMFWLAAAVLAVALGLAHLLVPDVVPIGFADEPQSSWAVMTAFVLRAIELIAAAVAIIALVVGVGRMIYRVTRSS